MLFGVFLGATNPVFLPDPTRCTLQSFIAWKYANEQVDFAIKGFPLPSGL